MIVPTFSSISEFLKPFLCEAIELRMSIDTSKSIHVITDCMSYRDFYTNKDAEQHLTFCMPLTKMTAHKQVRKYPRSTAISISWKPTQSDYPEIVPLIDSLFEQNGLVQSNALRVICNTGWILSSGVSCISEEDTVFRILVPFSNASQTDL